MKKFIFGCVLMLCGIIGGTGWTIATVTLVQPGAWSTILNMLDDIEGFIVIFFYIVAVIGAVIAIKAMKDDKNKE